MSKKKQITNKLSIDKDKDINDFNSIIESDIDDLELESIIDLESESESELESESDSDISITRSKDKLGLKKTGFSKKIEIVHHYDYDNIDIEDFDKYNDLVELIYESDSKKLSKLKEDKKRLFCDYCNDDDIVEDTSHGIIVCKSCGQVLSTLMDSNPEWTQYNDDNKKDMNRCSHPISQLLPQSSTATTISGSCSSRIKTLHGWGAMPYKERSLNEVFKIIQAKCADGKILKCIEDDAKIMYKNISDCKHITGKNNGKPIIIRGKNRMSVIAGCILYACRKKNKTRSPKEIAELFGLRYTEITKGCKIFQKLAKLKKIDYKFNFTKPEHFITRFCEELKIKQEYGQQAIQISDNVQKLQIASVHTPLSLATGSIFLMINLNGLNIQKKVIADKFNVSQVTIAKAFKKLEPFINILTNDKICEKLSVEIKKYQDDIEILEVLKPKFLRFNIDIQKTMGKPAEKIYSLVYKENGITQINYELIAEHKIEYDSKDKQYDNEFHMINENYMEIKYEILKNDLNF
jgi:transcription initiation factor TFIIB